MDKLVMIDHSYHAKTKSSSFIIDLLKEKYEVEIIYDDSWRGESEPDLSHIDNSYKGVVFWQNISKKMLKSINHENIIFFPMYDACSDVPLDYWYDIKNVKIINFSKNLHKKLLKLGFQSIYIQYYPEPIQCEVQKDKTIFYWHRHWEITWDTVKKLFPHEDIARVHIHKAVDPEQEFVQPSEDDEKNYNIKYSDWFESRQDYFNIVASESIYIAPRIMEGIGLSFLEAMAMGKVVVAANIPTMNEYIVHGVNGILYDYKDPQPLVIKDFELMQENAYETIIKGNAAWNNNKYTILDFIKIKPKENVYFSVKIKIPVIKNKLKKMVKKILKYALPYGIVRMYQNRKR